LTIYITLNFIILSCQTTIKFKVKEGNIPTQRVCSQCNWINLISRKEKDLKDYIVVKSKKFKDEGWQYCFPNITHEELSIFTIKQQEIIKNLFKGTLTGMQHSYLLHAIFSKSLDYFIRKEKEYRVKVKIRRMEFDFKAKYRKISSDGAIRYKNKNTFYLGDVKCFI